MLEGLKTLYVYLHSKPEEGETCIGTVPLNVREGRRLLSHLDDLIRIEAKWRSEPIDLVDKKIALSVINSPNNKFGEVNVAIDRKMFSGKQGWYVWSDRVLFYSSDMAQLSKFRNKVEMAVKWLERQK